MSRHTVTIFGPTGIDDEAVIGYDPPLRTFFVQGFFDAETDDPKLWLGTRLEQFPALPSLLDHLEMLGYSVENLDAGIVADMTEEASRPPKPCLVERLGWTLR